MHAVEFSRIGCSHDPVITTRPGGQLLYLIRVFQAVKPTRRKAQNQICSSGHTASEATSLAYPFRPRCQTDNCSGAEAPRQTEVRLRPSPKSRSNGGGSPLEGGEALGLSASLWGEQVISYGGSGVLANRGIPPGRVGSGAGSVSAGSAPVFTHDRLQEYARAMIMHCGFRPFEESTDGR